MMPVCEFFVAKAVEFWYTYVVMKSKTHLYVSRKNGLTWLMALCLVASALARIVLPGLKGSAGSAYVWSQIVLPVTATLLYALIALLDGEELFYKTAIPVGMLAIYAGIWISENVPSRMVTWLFWIALAFFTLLYTDLTAGRSRHATVLLMPVVVAPLAFVLYFYRTDLLQRNWEVLITCLPDLLLLLGGILMVFALRVHPAGEFHPTWGDRIDGRRLRTLPAANQLSPYIMVNRNGSSNLFEEHFEISNAERYIRAKRREGLTNFGYVHLLLACYCRGVAKYPGLNRFVSGQRIFSRGEDIQFSMTIKKEMTTDAAETEIKLHLSPRDTAYDVYEKMNAAVTEVKNTPLDATVDNVAAALMMIPGVFLKFVVWLLKTMDYFGLLPKFLLEVSPFHGSMYFTSMGSLGIPPIYHHLYDFGNIPVFAAFGMKRRATEVLEDGSLVSKKYMDVKFTLDERTVDGFYYATFLKYFKRLMQHPELLDEAPTEVNRDID